MEARSFSPPPEVPSVTRLGRFVTLSLPLGNFDAGTRFWGLLGADTEIVEQPWRQLRVLRHDFTLCFHSPALLESPLLLFHTSALREIRDGLAARGIAAGPGLGGFATPEHLLATSPEGLALVTLA